MEYAFLEPLMKFFVGVDAVVVALSIAFVAMMVALGLFFASRRLWRAAAICLAVAAAPYVLHALTFLGQDQGLKARAQQVEALERTPLEADYPRVLEAEVMPGVAGRFLALGLFDEVLMYGSAGPEGEHRTTYRWKKTTSCKAMAETVRRRESGDGPRGADSSDIEECVGKTWAWVPGPRPDAVVLLRGGDTTVRPVYQRHFSGSGAHELRLRQDGRDVLVDYWESPKVKRPRSAALGQSAFGGETQRSERLSFSDFVVRAIPES